MTYPPPPPKKNTGLIVGVIVAVVVVLGAVAITGFVAPGFFLSDEKQQDDDKSGGSKNPADPGGGPAKPPVSIPGGGADDTELVKRVAELAVTSIDTRDAELAKSISCDPSSAGDLSELPQDARAEVTGDPAQVGAQAFKVPVKFSAGGNSNQDFLEVEKHDGRWCVAD